MRSNRQGTSRANEDRTAELERLTAELGFVKEEFRELYRRKVHGWQLPLGPLRIRAKLGSGVIAQIYIAFTVLCAVSGAILVFVKPTKELGIALLAGAILAFGSFVTQFWASAMEHERSVAAAIDDQDEFRRLRQLARRWDKLEARIDATETSPEDVAS